MKDELAPEENSQVLDLVSFDGENVGDEEAAEKEEGVNGEETLLDGFEGARVLQLVQSPQWVVQVVDGEEKGVSKNHPERYCMHTLLVTGHWTKIHRCPTAVHTVYCVLHSPQSIAVP